MISPCSCIYLQFNWLRYEWEAASYFPALPPWRKTSEKVSNWNFAIFYSRTEAADSNSRFINFSSSASFLLHSYILYHLFIFIAKMLNIVILYRYRAIMLVVVRRSLTHRAKVENRSECIVCWAIKHNKHQSMEIDTHMIFNGFRNSLVFFAFWGEFGGCVW